MGALEGKVAIVTGAARGQGEAEARRFVAEGARVVFTDVLDAEGKAVAASLQADRADRAEFIHHDVSSEDDWRRVVDHTVDRFGRLDVLVNNAAIHRFVAIVDETVEGLKQILDVNLVGTFIGMRTAAEVMLRLTGGSIVNISSTAGLTGYPGHVSYGASKWAVRGMTKVAAVELGPTIRVNSVHPGPIATAMLGPDDTGLGEARFAHLPLARSGQVEEVADLLVFLASDASSFITGSEFVIDGGGMAGRRTIWDRAPGQAPTPIDVAGR